jgi:chemotaxis signal transduction protein
MNNIPLKSSLLHSQTGTQTGSQSVNQIGKQADRQTGSQINSPQNSRADQYITFKLADYLFALPSEKILKIVATPSPSQGGMVSMGLVQLEQYSIQIIDLIKLLNLKKQDIASVVKQPIKAVRLTDVDAPKNPPFLIVLQDNDQALWGIAVEEPPDLMAVPKYALKPVPAEKRLTRALRWVSHVVTYDLGGDRHTLLLLDMTVLLSSDQSPSSSQSPSFLKGEQPSMMDNTLIRETEMYV